MAVDRVGDGVPWAGNIQMLYEHCHRYELAEKIGSPVFHE
jgi:hypothetical protein